MSAATIDLTMGKLFDTGSLLHKSQFQPAASPFDFLGEHLKDWIRPLLGDHGVAEQPVVKGSVHPAAYIEGPVYVSEGAKIDPTAYIVGPCFIGPGAEIRHGAFIRGNVYVGKDCVVGHATEVKSSIFMDGAKAGHFAYVGDSILGQGVNLGAGTKLANFKFRGDEVRYRAPGTNEIVSSGLRKLGALMGDHSQTGCNAVLDPGAILFPKTVVMSCMHFRGTLTSGIARQR